MRTTDTEKIIELESLRIGYLTGKHENLLMPPITTSAFRGELIAVIGRNGIGKSTLLRTLTGLHPLLGGNVYIYGKNISSYSRIELARQSGYISTESMGVNNMNVYDLVSLGRYPYTDWTGRIEKRDHESIMNAIKKTGMTAFRERFISELSDGENQKAMIARLLAQDTGIMLMDEPTAFLDIGSKYEILDLLKMLSHEGGKTIIYSTHDLHMAITCSDKIWLLSGTGLAEGAPEDLIISGAFEHLFDPSAVEFDTDMGTYNFRSRRKGVISVEGDGIKRHWAEKALNRAGYSVSATPASLSVIVPSDDNDRWKISLNGSVTEFSAIYGMIRYLRGRDDQAI
jgi:iron complex transport system ATP-binding protein